MNKTKGLILTLLLSGCILNSRTSNFDSLPPIPRPEGWKGVYNGTIGLPWVRVIPSKRALLFKDVPFELIAEKIRACVDMEDSKCKSTNFKNLTSIMVDYAAVPTAAMNALINSEIAKIDDVVAKHKGQPKVSRHKPYDPTKGYNYSSYKGQEYATNYMREITGYVMTLSFYACDKTPPSAPFFVGTACINERRAGAFEAFAFLAEEIVLEHIHNPSVKETIVSLD